MTSRRGFLVGGVVLGAGAAAVAVGWRGGWLNAPVPVAVTPCGLGSTMDALLAQQPGLRRLGSRLGALLPDAAALSPEHLAAKVLDRIGELPPGADSNAAATLLRRRIAQDFDDDAGDAANVSLDGWQLSRTEALLALLAFRCLGDEVDGDLPPLSEQVFVTLEGWGPQRTTQGKSVNTQSDGHSGLWFRFAEPTQAWYEISVDGVRQPTFSSGKTLTSGLHGELQQRILANPGSYAVVLHDDMNRRWQTLGEFVVSPPPQPYVREDGSESANYCAIELWGPKSTRVGVAENPQPDGSMGIYVRTGCAPPDARLIFNGTELVTAVQASVVTARLPVSLLQTVGEFPLVLQSAKAGEEILIGNISVSSEPPAQP